MPPNNDIYIILICSAYRKSLQSLIDHEKEYTIDMASRILGEREELWDKFFSGNHTRHSRRLLLRCYKERTKSNLTVTKYLKFNLYFIKLVNILFSLISN